MSSEVVSYYGRGQAIEDGVLVDATVGDLAEVTRQHFKVPVAMTAAVFAILEAAVEAPRAHNDLRGLWHDLCWMLNLKVKLSSRESCDTLLFRVSIAGGSSTKLHEFKAVMAGDDTGEPCITILLPHED